MSVLSLGLLLPFGAGAFPDRSLAIVKDLAGQTPAKHITFLHGDERDTVETRMATVDDFLVERGITRRPEDRISPSSQTELTDGATIAYRPAINIHLSVDGVVHQLQSPAATVGELIANEQIPVGAHDRVVPAADRSLTPDALVTVTHITSWLERVRTTIAPPVTRKFDIALAAGSRRVVDPGSAGTKETTVAVLQPNAAVAPKRMFLATRVLRLPHMRIVAEGVAEDVTLGSIARRGFVGTWRLADAALKMVATAYTAGCSGCSGTTATGRPAGHGVVAVDPRIIPLGSHLFIPGYGHALAGDTGGAIHGNRIDLGFESHRDAMTFGRRPIVVYVLK